MHRTMGAVAAAGGLTLLFLTHQRPYNQDYHPNRCLNDFAEAIQQQLAAIGIGVDLEIGDSARQWDSYQSGDFDINGSNWTTVGTGDPTEYMAAWCSTSGADYCGYKNAEYDALFEELSTTFDNDARREIIQQMQQTREAMGLNRPMLIQYFDWLSHCFRGNFGTSYPGAAIFLVVVVFNLLGDALRDVLDPRDE